MNPTDQTALRNALLRYDAAQDHYRLEMRWPTNQQALMRASVRREQAADELIRVYREVTGDERSSLTVSLIRYYVTRCQTCEQPPERCVCEREAA